MIAKRNLLVAQSRTAMVVQHKHPKIHSRDIKNPPERNHSLAKNASSSKYRRTHKIRSLHSNKVNHSTPNKSIVAGYPAAGSPPPSNCTPRQYRRSCVNQSGVKAHVCTFNSPPPSNPPVANESRSAEDGTRGGKKPEDATLGAIVLVSTSIEASGEVVKP
jgi:hypothetical protein